MIVRAGAHNKWPAGCGGASYAPRGSLEFEMSKNILRPFRPCYRGRRISSVNSFELRRSFICCRQADWKKNRTSASIQFGFELHYLALKFSHGGTIVCENFSE